VSGRLWLSPLLGVGPRVPCATASSGERVGFLNLVREFDSPRGHQIAAGVRRGADRAALPFRPGRRVRDGGSRSLASAGRGTEGAKRRGARRRGRRAAGSGAGAGPVTTGPRCPSRSSHPLRCRAPGPPDRAQARGGSLDSTAQHLRARPDRPRLSRVAGPPGAEAGDTGLAPVERPGRQGPPARPRPQSGLPRHARRARRSGVAGGLCADNGHAMAPEGRVGDGDGAQVPRCGGHAPVSEAAARARRGRRVAGRERRRAAASDRWWSGRPSNRAATATRTGAGPPPSRA